MWWLGTLLFLWAGPSARVSDIFFLVATGEEEDSHKVTLIPVFWVFSSSSSLFFCLVHRARFRSLISSIAGLFLQWSESISQERVSICAVSKWSQKVYTRSKGKKEWKLEAKPQAKSWCSSRSFFSPRVKKKLNANYAFSYSAL